MTDKNIFAKNLNSLYLKTGLFNMALQKHGCRKVERAMNFALILQDQLEQGVSPVEAVEDTVNEIADGNSIMSFTDEELEIYRRTLDDLGWKYLHQLDYYFISRNMDNKVVESLVELNLILN